MVFTLFFLSFDRVDVFNPPFKSRQRREAVTNCLSHLHRPFVTLSDGPAKDGSTPLAAAAFGGTAVRSDSIKQVETNGINCRGR